MRPWERFFHRVATILSFEGFWNCLESPSASFHPLMRNSLNVRFAHTKHKGGKKMSRNSNMYTRKHTTSQTKRSDFQSILD